MNKLTKEQFNKAAQRFAREGISKANLSKQLHVSPLTIAKLFKNPDSSFSQATYDKLTAYSEGKSFTEIAEPKKAETASKRAVAVTPPKSAENTNIQVLIDRIKALESLTHTQNQTIELLMSEVKMCMNDRESNNKKVSQAMESIETMDRRQKYVSSTLKQHSEDINRLRIKLEPTKFTKR